MLAGQYESKLGEKFQVSFPKKFREKVGNKLILTKGIDDCLVIVAESNWEVFLEGTNGLPFINTKAREVNRFLFGNAVEIEIDTKGRILVPEFLRVYAELEETVVFVGANKYIEVWDQSKWQKRQNELKGEKIMIITDTLNNSAQKESRDE